MYIVVNHDVRVEQTEPAGNMLIKIWPHDQTGRDAEPTCIEVKMLTAQHLLSALMHWASMQNE